MRTRPVLITLALVLVAVACGDDDGGGVRDVGDGAGSATGSGSASGSDGSGSGSASGRAGGCEPVGELSEATTRVTVGLDEWTVVPEPASAPAGRIGFITENQGKEAHELVVIRGVAPADLPLERNGSLDEQELPAGALVGEVEAFPPGETCNGVFDLEPGEYTLLCNVREHGNVHLDEGMVTTFTVT
jgi:hypothetical protein